MITIGVTGGVGSGKSEILSYLEKEYNCRILMSDNAAKELEKPGGVLYTSFKYGTFEGIRDGRYFTDFTEEKLDAFWKEATSMQIAESWITEDVRSDRKGKQWINLISRRV